MEFWRTWFLPRSSSWACCSCSSGILLERRKKVVATDFYPRIDLNDRAQRSAVISFATFLIVFVMVSTAGSYKAYEFTDSVAFCGQLCHTVMHPEYVAYQRLRMRAWPARSATSAGCDLVREIETLGRAAGLRRTFNTFPRPIPTPVHNLRPAHDTCEQCHWPEKFYGAQLKVFTHYANDEKNTSATGPHADQDAAAAIRDRRARRHSLAHEHRQ